MGRWRKPSVGGDKCGQPVRFSGADVAAGYHFHLPAPICFLAILSVVTHHAVNIRFADWTVRAPLQPLINAVAVVHVGSIAR